MLISDALKKIHLKFAKDTDYPETGNEDRLVYLEHIDDALSEYEDCVHEGYCWPELKTTDSIVCAGMGTDALPANFLAFVATVSVMYGFQPSVIIVGGVTYEKVDISTGVQAKQAGLSPCIFWQEGTNLCTLPAITGTIDLPYVRKITRYITGDETDPIEVSEPSFVVEYALGKTYLDNEDDTQAQMCLTTAKEKLTQMKHKIIA